MSLSFIDRDMNQYQYHNNLTVIITMTHHLADYPVGDIIILADGMLNFQRHAIVQRSLL